MKEKKFHLFYKVLLNKTSFNYCDPKQKYLVVFHKHKIIYSYIYSYSYIYFLKVKLERDLYLYNFVFANFFCIFLRNYFWKSGRLVCDLAFSDFLSFFFTAFLSINIKIVSKGNKTKSCVSKSYDVIITKYTLHAILAFTV